MIENNELKIENDNKEMVIKEIRNNNMKSIENTNKKLSHIK